MSQIPSPNSPDATPWQDPAAQQPVGQDQGQPQHQGQPQYQGRAQSQGQFQNQGQQHAAPQQGQPVQQQPAQQAPAQPAPAEPQQPARRDAEPAQRAPRENRGHREAQPELDPKLDGRAKGGATGATWVALIIGLIILILLLVFVLQNMNDVLIAYMAWEFTLPLGVAMLLAAIAGALIMAMVGSIRLIVVSRRLHKLEKERESIKRTLR